MVLILLTDLQRKRRRMNDGWLNLFLFFLAALQKLLSCASPFPKIWFVSYMDKDPKAFDRSQNRNVRKQSTG